MEQRWPVGGRTLYSRSTSWRFLLTEIFGTAIPKSRLPKSNCDYWEKKILGNRTRDKAINRELKSLGWRVLRIWESSLTEEEVVIGS